MSRKHIGYAFIDASNLWATQKAKGKMLDFEKLRNFLKAEHAFTDLRVFYYAAYPANGTRDYSMDGKHKFFTYLSKRLGFVVRKKELKRIVIHADNGDLIEEKGNMDVEMAIDAVHFKDNFDVALLFSGDSDFLRLVSYLRNAGKTVHVYSSRNNISQELRYGADSYTDVLDIRTDVWGRNLVHRASKSS